MRASGVARSGSRHEGSDRWRWRSRSEDDGAGVVPEQREKIYQPFFTTKAQGTGLGLAIVHSIVTQHRGSLRLESSEKGGAAFRIRLPAA